MKPNCIGIIKKREHGLLKYYWCKLQFWKYRPTRLSGYEDGALSYGAYDPRYKYLCMHCLPPTPLDGHKTLYGAMIHTRIDCPKDTVYFINDDQFKK
jgi:hypothetical protein